MSALILVYLASLKKWPKSLGRSHIVCVACDRSQAGVVLGYAKSILNLPAFAGLVESEGAEEIRLKNSITVGVHTSSFRALRGYKILAAVADEVAFWRDDSGSANPAQEVLNAIRPALGEVEGSLMLCISSAYSKSGPMYEAVKNRYGIEDDSTLVWRAGTSDMNPLYSRAVIERARADDPQAAASEFDSAFREDLETYISTEALDAVVVRGRLELPPQRGLPAFGAVDPSGGRNDSMTLSIFYREPSGKAVQACLRVQKSPFDPSECVKSFASVLRSYGISTVTGDRYSGNFCTELFQKSGILYRNSEKSKSQIYGEFLPLIMRGGIELLDIKQQTAELRQLERRHRAGGRDVIDHPQGLHDDMANATALSAILASKEVFRDNSVFESNFSQTRASNPIESAQLEFSLRLAGAAPDSAALAGLESEEALRAELRADEEANRKELFGESKGRTFHGWGKE